MNRNYVLFMSVAAILSVGSLLYYWFNTEPVNTTVIAGLNTEYISIEVEGPIQPLPSISYIDSNWVSLGKALFNSPLLSADNTVSCASCHAINLGGDDGFPVSVGINGATGTRNSPTVLNAVFNIRQFWDGRAASLADQLEGPIHNPIEMGSNWEQIIFKLTNDTYFNDLFNSLSTNGVTIANITRALVIFEESLITPDAPIDRYIKGDKTALTEQQKRGLDKFTNLGCVACHQGRNIGGNIFQKIGALDVVPEKLLQDRGIAALSEDENDKFRFKVPSLRNVAHTAPYFHNGSVATLEEAVTIMAKTQLGVELSQEDISDLVALLKSFSGKIQEL